MQIIWSLNRQINKDRAETLKTGTTVKISRAISVDIIEYLQNRKGQSVDDIARAMATTTDHIQNVINKKEPLQSEDVESYLKNSHFKFWEFVLEAIPLEHLPKKARSRIKLCKEINDYIKKKKI